jgi:putative tryptophan/tyrosine transport system substrate-binding protein
MQFHQLKRREFITLLAGAAAARPLAARAQQPALPVIGFLGPGSAESDAYRVKAFRQGLNASGYVEGQNLTIEYRWGEGHYDRLPAMASDLVHRQVAVIAATSTPAALAAKAATTTIPIVFTIPDDPVQLGLVASLSRPGGNLTGVYFLVGELVPKRLELLRELVPAMTRVAVFVNPANPARAEFQVKEAESAARQMALRIQIINAATGREINTAFATLARERPDALLVSPDPLYVVRRVQLATLAARHAIPTSFSNRDPVEAGGLMSYGTNIADAYRLAGAYTGRILRGAKPADLPVVQSTKFELVINAQTALMLGLAVPPTLLSVADEVIE